MLRCDAESEKPCSNTRSPKPENWLHSIRIETDPNAEGFYKRTGASGVGASVHNVEGKTRTLPLLEFRLTKSS